jgi:transcriptional regulator with XRE-family HTH domain
LEAKEFGEYLKSIRKKKKMTIRQLELYSKVSNAYISQLERGDRGIPSPDILKKLSTPLGVNYSDLMIKAGYVDENEKESEIPLPKSNLDNIVRRIEEESGVSIDDDPVILESIEANLRAYAKLKKNSINKK